MQELGNAINDSLSESDRIAEAIGEIKRAGYDVFLVLEATIGFNRRDENAEDEEDNQPEVTEEPKRTFEATGKIKFTTQDHRFLRALKIAVDDENRRYLRVLAQQSSIDVPGLADGFLPGERLCPRGSAAGQFPAPIHVEGQFPKRHAEGFARSEERR